MNFLISGLYQKFKYYLYSLGVTTIFWILSKKVGVNIFDSDNIVTLLSAAISGISVMVGVYGVLLSSFVAIKENSSAVNFFLKNVNGVELKNCMLRCVRNGLISIFLSSVLIIKDVINDKLLNVFEFVWIFITLSFFMEICGFIKILLNLLIDDKKYGYNPELSDEEIKSLRGKIAESNKNKK